MKSVEIVSFSDNTLLNSTTHVPLVADRDVSNIVSDVSIYIGR